VEVNNLLSASKLQPLGRTSLCLVALKLQLLPLVEHNKRTNLHLGHLGSVNNLSPICLVVVRSNNHLNLVNKQQEEGCLGNSNSRPQRLVPLGLSVSSLRIKVLDCLASNKLVQPCLELSQQLQEGQVSSEILKEA